MRRMSSAALYSSRAYKLPAAQTWNGQCAAKAELLPHTHCSPIGGILSQAENADFLKSLSLNFGEEETIMRNLLGPKLKASPVML